MYLGVSRHYRIIGSCFAYLNKCLSMPMCLDVEGIETFGLDAFCQKPKYCENRAVIACAL